MQRVRRRALTIALRAQAVTDFDDKIKTKKARKLL